MSMIMSIGSTLARTSWHRGHENRRQPCQTIARRKQLSKRQVQAATRVRGSHLEMGSRGIPAAWLGLAVGLVCVVRGSTPGPQRSAPLLLGAGMRVFGSAVWVIPQLTAAECTPPQPGARTSAAASSCRLQALCPLLSRLTCKGVQTSDLGALYLSSKHGRVRHWSSGSHSVVP